MNDHEVIAVKVEEVVMVAAVNDSATFGAVSTVNEQVKLPVASELHGAAVIVTAVESTGAIVIETLEAKPVPVAVRV